MQQKLNSALSQMSLENQTPRRQNSNPPVSPSPRNSRHLDPSTIQAMFPDAAAALAHQRSLLSSNRNSMNGLPITSAPLVPRSPGLQAAKDAWPIPPPPPATGSDTPSKIRPKSADLSANWQATQSTPAQVKSPRAPTQTPMIAEDLASPFGVPLGGSWASMVNTPVVPMFSNTHTGSSKGGEDVASAAAAKIAAWNASQNRSSVSGGIINLDSDVRKFRRGGKATLNATQSDSLATPTHISMARGGSPTNIVMYDEHGHIVIPATQVVSIGSVPRPNQSPLALRSRPTSPYPPGFPLHSLGTGISSPVALGMSSQPAFLNPYDSSPIIPPAEFVQGYLSDHTPDRRPSPLSFANRMKYSPHTPGAAASNGRRVPITPKHQEDPLDPALLKDIPSWLRSLRLHKYTENLADVKGGVLGLAQLSEEGLERRGVSAVGARRKLIKCFELVRSGMTTTEAGES
jgi:SAM domain (Sterile alpha motif)